MGETMPELSGAVAYGHLRAGSHVRCSRCGRWVGPSDSAWMPDDKGGVECGLCVTGLDLGPGVTYPCPSDQVADDA